MKKVYSMKVAFLSIVLSGMMALALLVGGVSLWEISRFVQSSTKELITEKCEKEAAQLNEIFSGMEKSVRIMESYILDLVDSVENIRTSAGQDELVLQSNHFFGEVAKNTSNTVAYYFRFSPDFSENMGFFYSKVKGETGFVAFEPTDISLYPKDDKAHVGWYWEPYTAGTAIWITPYYNKNNDITMISFVIPLYYQNEFFGVVGMDFDYSIMTDRIHEIKIYENGYAHLEKDGAIIHYNDNRREFPATQPHPNDYRTERELRNGMVLVITADHRDMISIQHGILLKTVVITLALTVILSGVVILLVRRIVRPLQALTEAAEKLAQNEYDVHFTPGNTTEIAQLTATFKHMSEKLRDHNELQQILAYRDSLTGLKNATAFNTWRNDFERQWQETPPEFAVLVLDINNLKGTNDQYGHEVGNQLIVAASRIIADTFKRSPVFRIGGDEFLVILRNRDLQNHENLIREVSASFEEKFLIWGNQTIPVSIAIGIAEYDPRMDSSFTDVFNRADSAMYENKRKKKARMSTHV